MQCKGTTKKGARCRIQGSGDYCHHHTYQSKPLVAVVENKPKVHPPPADKQGYIYVYTLAKASEARVFDSNSQKYRSIEQSLWRRLFSSQKLLVKVGFTTRTPNERMHQWESQCKHELRPVVPKRNRYAPRYDHHMNGWQSKSAYKVEQSILSQLRQKYGTGHVKCGACTTLERPGLHIEWFLISSKHVKQVFKIIEASII